MFSPLHNTHMHILFVYSDKVNTIENTLHIISMEICQECALMLA